jgi:DNA repair protein RadC
MTPSEAIEFLAACGCYPNRSSLGLFFLRPRSVLIDDERLVQIREALESNYPDLAEARLEISHLRRERRQQRPIREWAESERPREMLLAKGAETLPLAKLLAILLRTGREGISAETLAQSLLTKYQTLRALDAAPVSQLLAMASIGPAKVAQLKAALELGKRLMREEASRTTRIKNPQDAARYVAYLYGPYLRDSRKESFRVIFLDTKNQPISDMEISLGTVNASLVDPGEIIREASLRSAVSLILVHNHPSGDPEPSNEDIRLTRVVAEACKLIGIKVLDHIVIGRNEGDLFSLQGAGLI